MQLLDLLDHSFETIDWWWTFWWETCDVIPTPTQLKRLVLCTLGERLHPQVRYAELSDDLRRADKLIRP